MGFNAHIQSWNSLNSLEAHTCQNNLAEFRLSARARNILVTIFQRSNCNSLPSVKQDIDSSLWMMVMMMVHHQHPDCLHQECWITCRFWQTPWDQARKWKKQLWGTHHRSGLRLTLGSVLCKSGFVPNYQCIVIQLLTALKSSRFLPRLFGQRIRTAGQTLAALIAAFLTGHLGKDLWAESRASPSSFRSHLTLVFQAGSSCRLQQYKRWLLVLWEKEAAT